MAGAAAGIRPCPPVGSLVAGAIFGRAAVPRGRRETRRDRQGRGPEAGASRRLQCRCIMLRPAAPGRAAAVEARVPRACLAPARGVCRGGRLDVGTRAAPALDIALARQLVEGRKDRVSGHPRLAGQFAAGGKRGCRAPGGRPGSAAPLAVDLAVKGARPWRPARPAEGGSPMSLSAPHDRPFLKLAPMLASQMALPFGTGLAPEGPFTSRRGVMKNESLDPDPSPFPVRARSKVRRLPERGSPERADVYAILDSHFLCHIAYVIDGQPFVTPTGYWRDGDRVYWQAPRPAACCAIRRRGCRSA